ncbi:MAG: hypothetical protein KF886_08060 [Candidatus Hydrogenedentes bacterium]|nr:hypothetical protein [Candidatus Hydrogenedentota bacterium]
MDKLQKFFKAIWRYKERIVFVVLLGVLGYRVYQLFNPQEPVSAASPPTGAPEPPQIAPNAPSPDPPGQYYNMIHRSPFSYYSDAEVDPNRVRPEDLGLQLLDIKPVGGKLRARVKTESARKWYDEGESFEEFILESIDAEDRSAVVYVERLGQSVTLRLP